MSAAAKSVREEIVAAMTPEVEAPEVEAVETPEVVETPEKPERARDEHGRFVAKTEPETVEQPETPATPDKPTLTAVPDVEPEKVETALAPPNGWAPEAKAKWHELPAEIQAAVNKREQDVAKFTSTRDEHASFGKEIYQTIQPYMAQIRAEGGTPVRAVESLLNTAYLLRTGSAEQKKQLLLQTARQFGVDLGLPAQPGQPAQQVPDVSHLVRLEMERAQRQRFESEAQQEIAAFAADPKHPHYIEVKAHMAALLDKGAAKDLQDAYDQACWANPTVRTTLLAQQRADEEQKRRSEAKAKADAAKRKSIGITGGPGNTAAKSAPESKGSVRDDLLEAMNAHSGAV